jgi:hypothetical protein
MTAFPKQTSCRTGSGRLSYRGRAGSEACGGGGHLAHTCIVRMMPANFRGLWAHPPTDPLRYVARLSHGTV